MSLSSLDIYQNVELLDHMAVLFKFSEETPHSSTVAIPTYIPTNSVGGFPFPHILTTFAVYRLSHTSNSDRCEVTPHCGFDLRFSDNS